MSASEAAIEAVLAACGAIELSELAALLGEDRAALLGMLERMSSRPDRGVCVRLAGELVLFEVTEEQTALARRALGLQDRRLSRAALEVLAIVAYLQPVSRGQISEVRGVASDGVVRTLVERGLVEEVPGTEPAALRTTRTFLARCGLASVEELPPLGRFVPSASVLEDLEEELRIQP